MPPQPQQVSQEFIDNAIKENLGKLFGLQEAAGGREGAPPGWGDTV